MLVEEEEIKYKSNCFLFFWKAPRTYIIPQAPPGHIYIPLEEFKCINIKRPIVSYFPEIQNLIDAEIFEKIYNISKAAIRSNFFLMLLIFLSYTSMFPPLIPMASLFATKNILGGIICLLITIGLMILMKICYWIRQVGLKSKEKKLRKVLDEKAANILEGSGFIVKVGRLGLWLDFYRGEYYEAVENYNPNL